MSRTVPLLASMALMVLLACGVALAAQISCPNRVEDRCVGTAQNDTMTGTNASDRMSGGDGNDTVRALGATTGSPARRATTP